MNMADIEEILGMNEDTKGDVLQDWATSFVNDDNGERILLSLKDLNDGKLDRIEESLADGQIVSWANVPVTHSLDPKDNRYISPVSGIDKELDIIFSTALDFEKDCRDAVPKYKDQIVRIVSSQYDAIMIKALSKIKESSTTGCVNSEVHLYPLLPMDITFSELNLEALSNTLEKYASFGPKLNIVFHHVYPTDRVIKTEGYNKYYGQIARYFTMNYAFVQNGEYPVDS